MIKKPSQKTQKNWNKRVDKPVTLLRQVGTWLKKQKKSDYTWTWQDHVRLKRAQCYVALALVETESLKYFSSEEIRLQKQDEFYWLKLK